MTFESTHFQMLVEEAREEPHVRHCAIHDNYDEGEHLSLTAEKLPPAFQNMIIYGDLHFTTLTVDGVFHATLRDGDRK